MNPTYSLDRDSGACGKKNDPDIGRLLWVYKVMSKLVGDNIAILKKMKPRNTSKNLFKYVTGNFSDSAKF